MPREPIPEDLRRFILTSVPSVPFVEAMLLFREAGDTPLGIAHLSRRLYVSERATLEIVDQLRDARLIQRVDSVPPGYRFAPDSAELAAVIEVLVNFYRSQLVDVTDLIHFKAGRKAQQFADAFKLRRD